MPLPRSQQQTGDDTTRLLSLIEQHLRLLIRLQLAPVHASQLSSPELKNLYRATGTKSVATLAKEFGMSTGKISTLWQTWEQAGLLRKNGHQYERTF